MSTVNDRINELIELFHRGSVNAAAQTAGIPQRTLARVCEGTPARAELLERLVRTYGGHAVTSDWLLTGTGKGPDRVPSPSAHVLHWDRLVIDVSRDLNLPPATHTALLDTPRDMEFATGLFDLVATRPPLKRTMGSTGRSEELRARPKRKSPPRGFSMSRFPGISRYTRKP